MRTVPFTTALLLASCFLSACTDGVSTTTPQTESSSVRETASATSKPVTTGSDTKSDSDSDKDKTEPAEPTTSAGSSTNATGTPSTSSASASETATPLDSWQAKCSLPEVMSKRMSKLVKSHPDYASGKLGQKHMSKLAAPAAQCSQSQREALWKSIKSSWKKVPASQHLRKALKVAAESKKESVVLTPTSLMGNRFPFDEKHVTALRQALGKEDHRTTQLCTGLSGVQLTWGGLVLYARDDLHPDMKVVAFAIKRGKRLPAGLKVNFPTYLGKPASVMDKTPNVVLDLADNDSGYYQYQSTKYNLYWLTDVNRPKNPVVEATNREWHCD